MGSSRLAKNGRYPKQTSKCWLTQTVPESIRAAASDPDFLLGVLDYLVSDEELLLAFANENSFDPAHVASARDILAGPPVTD